MREPSEQTHRFNEGSRAAVPSYDQFLRLAAKVAEMDERIRALAALDVDPIHKDLAAHQAAHQGDIRPRPRNHLLRRLIRRLAKEARSA